MSDTSDPNNPAKTLARTPRWFKVVFVIAVLFWLVGVSTPYLLNVDRYRARIANLISEQTGRQVTLGTIRARILPPVGFDVDGFHMTNPPGFGAGDFVSAEHVRGSLAFWPLVLHHRLRLISLELMRPRLALLQNNFGENNYTFPAASTSRSSQSRIVQPAPIAANYLQANFAAALPQHNDAVSDDVPPVSSVLQVDELILRDATVIYGSVDAAGHIESILQSAGFHVILRHMQLQPLMVPAWQADANLSGARVTLADWNGPIAFRSGSVTLRNADLESKFSVDFGKAARVDGTLSVSDVQHAVVKFDLQSSDVNVDQLEAGAQTGKPRGAPAAAQMAPASNAAPAELISAPATNAGASSVLLAQGHLDAKKVRWGAYVTGPASADLRFYGDRLEIWPVTVRFADGSLQASVRTDSRQTPQRFAVNLEARNINVEQLLERTPPLRGKLAGTGELDLQVFGSLEAAWLRSLTGKGEFAVRNGRISGFNLSGAAQSITNLAGVNGNTTFAAITGDLDIGQERLISHDIHLDSSIGTLDMKGSCGLNSSLDNSLDYDGQISAQFGAQSGTGAQSSGKGASNSLADVLGRALAKNQIKLTVPFMLHGTLQHPQILPGHGEVSFPAPAESHSTDKGLSYPNLFQQQAPAISPGGNSQ